MGMRLAGMAVLVACGVAAQGQAAQDPTALQDELEKLGVAALSLQRDLPSFECQETAVSQSLKKGKVKEQVRFVGTVRAERSEEGRLEEALEVTELNGKAPRGSFDPPFMVGGGFAQSLGFFLPETQACFRYTLSYMQREPQSYTKSQGRIDFVSPPGTFDRPACVEKGAPDGFVLLDDVGNPTHLERRVPPEYAPQVHVVDFAAMDFAPTELDGKVYPLTAKMVSDVAKADGVTLHFEATYTGCHLFKATSRILPGETVVPDAGTPHP